MLRVVIGKKVRNVPASAALDYVFGNTCGDDMAVCDLQQTDDHWTRATAGNILCPLGPWIATELDHTDLSIKVLVNDELRQDGRTSDMIFRIPDIIEYLSSTRTLAPGDAILTCTPLGTRPVVDGDVVEIQVKGLGTLRNTVRQA